MATTDVDIVNQTLSLLGDVGAIAALDQRGNEPARRARIHYSQAKGVALARHDWGFARQYVAPAVVATRTTTPAIVVGHWNIAYMYPIMCAAVRMVVPPTYNPSEPDPKLRVPYEMGHWATSDTEEKTILYCNLEQAIVAYTFDVNEAFMPAPFIDYLVSELALRLIVPIAKAKPTITRSVQTMNERAWGIATTHDSKQQMIRNDEFVPATVRERM